jgi:hypothetical protein
MAILLKKSDGYWNYFLALERDLETLSRYVDFTTDNMATYSLEMARILLAAGAEADVLLKAICRREDPQAKAKTVGRYFEVLSLARPEVMSFEVRLPRWGASLKPWEGWTLATAPAWWTSCNKIKHQRDGHFNQANLLRTIEAVSAVFVLNLYWNPTAASNGKLLPTPQIFRPGDAHLGGSYFDNYEFGIQYLL